MRVLMAAGLVLALSAAAAQAAPAKTYAAKENGEAVTITVTPQGSDWHMSILRSGANGCNISLDGPAKLEGSTFHMTADSTGKACDVQLTPKSGFVEVIEGKCEAHGDACRIDDLPVLQPH